MPGLSFAKLVANCEVVRLNLEPMLAENPLLAPRHDELVAYLEEAKAVLARQSDMRGLKQDATRLRKESLAKGHDLFSRIAALLRSELGFKNEQLLKFGLSPRRRPRRSRKEGPAPPDGAIPPAPTPATPTPTPPSPVVPQAAKPSGASESS